MAIKRYTIGLDPGGLGGYALFENEKLVDYMDYESIGSSSIPDKNYTARMLRKWRKLDNVMAFLEDVHALFNSSAKNTFNFGWHKGILEGQLSALKIKTYLVQPKEWQAYSWKGITTIKVKKPGNKKKTTDTKATSILAARNLFPDHTFIKKGCKNPNMGMVDAALIGWYGVKARPWQ